MKILGFRTIKGPNVYHSQPVLMMKIDLQQWSEKGSHEIPGFTDRLIHLIPSLRSHTCSPGYPGGFIERLRQGTYPAHIVEHLALELSCLADSPLSFGKTRYAGSPGVYDVIVRFHNEEGMKLCLQSGVEIFLSLAEGKEVHLASKLEAIQNKIIETQLGPSTQALWDAACKRGIPIRTWGDDHLLELGHGKYRRRLQTAVSDRTSLIATDLVQDKQRTKQVLEEACVPVPRGEVVSSEAELWLAAEKIPGPYAVKPLDGHHGNGVALNMTTQEELLKAFHRAQEYCSRVLVEEMCGGLDYRVLVVNGRFVAASERTPPSVIGDGKRQIQELIESLNQSPSRQAGHGGLLSKIEIDEVLIETLQKQGWNLDSVPKKNQFVLLRPNANLSSGGTARDVTDLVHPEVKSLCERIARLVDLDICGIDLISLDLAASLENSNLRVIEVNAGPGLRMHLAPTEGQVRNVGEDILKMLYPPGTPFRIPIAAVTGTNGKTTVVRLIHKILSSDATVGMTTSDGIWIGDQKIASGDMTGPLSAQMILSDPLVEKAVLEVARGGILRRGLAYDWSDVGVITNIRPDHIGQDGIETLEDLVWIKSLVAERVKENGTLILNADDPEAFQLRLSPRLKNHHRHLVLYSVDGNQAAFREHILSGGDGAWYEEGWLYLQTQGITHRLVSVQNLSFTFEGRARFQISNALAAIAASNAMGATSDQIIMGLMSFESITENRGRMNLYRVGEGLVILDYGHNPDAISAMGEFLQQWPEAKKTAVFGLPGDRADHILQMATENLCQYFDRLVVRDDHDLRERKKAEVSDLVEKWVKAKSERVICRKAASEKEAVESVLSHLQSDEIVVIYFDSFESVMPLIRQYDPVPIAMIPNLEKSKVKEEPEWASGDQATFHQQAVH
ncbi:MAG: cyanophycin synthetase [Pseudobdellovibrionaceae bacterium]